MVHSFCQKKMGNTDVYKIYSNLHVNEDVNMQCVITGNHQYVYILYMKHMFVFAHGKSKATVTEVCHSNRSQLFQGSHDLLLSLRCLQVHQRPLQN